MRIHTRLALMACFLALAACDKKETSDGAPAAANEELASKEPAMVAGSPAATPCAQCKWDEFLGKDVPVQRIECTYPSGQVTHCHLLPADPNIKLTQFVKVEYDEDTGGYSFNLWTTDEGYTDNKMECTNLVLDGNNPRVLQGTCVIHKSAYPPGVHHFRATVQPFEEKPEIREIMFEARHNPFDRSQSQEVHNGEGHAHIP